MNKPSIWIGLAAAAALAGPFLYAQAPDRVSGHWEGELTAGDRTLQMELDIAKNDQGAWHGDVDVPGQNLKDIAIARVAVNERSVSFALAGVPGGPAFDGTVSEDGQSMEGTLSQGGKSVAWRMKRAGDAKVYVPPPNTAIAREFEGEWQGTLDAGARQFRLKLKLESEGSTSKGTLVSLDQNNVSLTVDTIEQKDLGLKFGVKVIFGKFDGKLNAEGTEIAGDWTQGPNALPLVLKRVPPAASEPKP